MSRSVFNQVRCWFGNREARRAARVNAELARLQEEAERGIDSGVRAIAESFFEPERWVEISPSPSGIGTRSWRDVVTYRIVTLQSIPDPMPFADPDLSADWLPDSEFEIRHYLTREWKNAQRKHRQRKLRVQRDEERAEFCKVKQEYLGDQGE